MRRTVSGIVNGHAGSYRAERPDAVIDQDAEEHPGGNGYFVVTLPDGTELTLIGATRLVLAFSDWAGTEIGSPS